MRSIFQNLKNDPQYSRQLMQETLILDVTEDLVLEMRSLGMDRVTLASRLGKTKAFVSQILGGSRNMTLRTLADYCWALGLVPKVSFVHEEKLEALESHPLTAVAAEQTMNVYHFKTRSTDLAAKGGLAA